MENRRLESQFECRHFSQKLSSDLKKLTLKERKHKRKNERKKM